MDTYKIVRMYFHGARKTIATGLTLEEAKEHCADPETSSSTCQGAEGIRRTRRCGRWFDGFEEE
jgi:hypothetical protein